MITNEDIEEIKNIKVEEEHTNGKRSASKSPKKDNKKPIEDPKTKKAKKVEPVKTNPVIKEKIIDLEELSKKEEPIDNSEVLLSLFEITNNSELYGLSSSNKSRHFWDQLVEVKVFSKVLEAFKSETLRKYWRTLSEISTNDKVISTIHKYKDSINSTSLKLLTIISTIKDYLAGRISDLEKQLNESPDRNIKPSGTTGRGKQDDDDSYQVDPKDIKILKNKRSKPEKDIVANTLAKNIEDVNKKNLFNITNTSKNTKVDTEENGKRALRPRSTPGAVFSSSDTNLFAQIEIIVNTLKGQFPELNELDIWEALKRNSFNIIDTYHSLEDPEQYEGK